MFVHSKAFEQFGLVIRRPTIHDGLELHGDILLIVPSRVNVKKVCNNCIVNFLVTRPAIWNKVKSIIL
jgi:hypothetical protein